MRDQNLHIGTSAFANDNWKGVFFPDDIPRSKWFEYYCKYFNTYEINATFYRLPTIKSLQSWYNKTPAGFLFALKAHKAITHIKRFCDCKDEIDAFYELANVGLREKLGFVLFQLPPGFTYSEERLNLVLSSMHSGFRNVIEFRHESWWQEAVYEALAKRNVIFCNVSYARLPTGIVKTTPTGYVRFHGVPKLFYSKYSLTEMQRWYNAIKRADWTQAFVYFNNTASTAGILNAMEMENFRTIL